MTILVFVSFKIALVIIVLLNSLNRLNSARALKANYFDIEILTCTMVYHFRIREITETKSRQTIYTLYVGKN